MTIKKTYNPHTEVENRGEKTAKNTRKPPVKKHEKTASERQKKAVKIMHEKMAEKGGFSMREVLEEAGFSKSVQDTPEKVFGTASMKRAMKSAGLDLKSLKMKHKQLLNMGRIDKIECSMNIPPQDFVDMVLAAMPGSRFLNYWDNPTFRSRTMYFIIPDVYTQAKMLEMQYKILGEFAPEKHAITDSQGNDVTIYIPDNNRNQGNK